MQLLSRFDLSVIHTDSEGRPIPRPDPLPANASAADFVVWQREVSAYFDRLTELGNRAFERKLKLKP